MGEGQSAMGVKIISTKALVASTALAACQLLAAPLTAQTASPRCLSAHEVDQNILKSARYVLTDKRIENILYNRAYLDKNNQAIAYLKVTNGDTVFFEHIYDVEKKQNTPLGSSLATSFDDTRSPDWPAQKPTPFQLVFGPSTTASMSIFVEIQEGYSVNGLTVETNRLTISGIARNVCAE
jgi:hypothetical protein